MANDRARRAVVAPAASEHGTTTVEAYRAAEAMQTTEAQFQRALVLTAKDYGWTHIYHTRFSVGSDRGFPDLVLLREDRCLVIECKRVGKEPTEKQYDWLTAWSEIPGVKACVFTPADWDAIHEVLK